MQDIRLGSCFSGIGGFELGLHWSIPNLKTVWQIEQNKFCQKVLKKHWPHSVIYEDITTIKTEELESIDILCGGFPCQDISISNSKWSGLDGKKSGLFWEMLRVISDLKEQGRGIPIILLENVSAITLPGRGLGDVLGSLSKIGYCIEYFTLRASDFGAPHRRERWFGVAHTDGKKQRSKRRQSMEKTRFFSSQDCKEIKNNKKGGYWEEAPSESAFCTLDDGIPKRMAKLRALGNAIVPQCSQWIGERLIETGLIEDILGGDYVYQNRH